MRTRTAIRMARAGMASFGLLLLAGAASAQTSAVDPRWSAWLGCWSPEAADPMAAGASPLVCVLPAASGGGVEVATVRDGAVTARESIDATGARVQTDRESCTGWTTAEWSADGRRVYRRSEHTCPGGFQRNSTGVMSMTPAGDWVDVEGLAAGEQEAVRVLRYRPATGVSTLPAEVTARLDGMGMTASTARLAASAPVTTAQVVEAAAKVGPGVVEAWLVERGQGFALELDARRLLEMKRAGVADRVIDMAVALTYPDRFAINRESGRATERRDDDIARAPRGMDYPGYGWGYFPGYGYGYDYGYGYGYGAGYGYGYYGRPVVVVRDDDETPRSGGRMVNGRGYSGGRNGDSTTQPSNRPSGNSGNSGSSGGSSSGGSSSGGGDSGGSVRTAKPRN